MFAENGDHVVAAARNLRALRDLRRHIEENGRSCEVVACDIKDESQVRKVSGVILKKYRFIDVLVNNAGVTYFKDFLSTSVREFDEVIGTNLRGLFLTTKSVVPSMLRRKRGVIVNILSFAAKTIYTKSTAYSASKSGAEAMMNVLRAEVRNSGVKIINVYPGAVFTPMWAPKHRKKYSKRMIDPNVVARLVYEASSQPLSAMVEELIIRPQGGDLRI